MAVLFFPDVLVPDGQFPNTHGRQSKHREAAGSTATRYANAQILHPPPPLLSPQPRGAIHHGWIRVILPWRRRRLKKRQLRPYNPNRVRWLSPKRRPIPPPDTGIYVASATDQDASANAVRPVHRHRRKQSVLIPVIPRAEDPDSRTPTRARMRVNQTDPDRRSRVNRGVQSTRDIVCGEFQSLGSRHHIARSRPHDLSQDYANPPATSAWPDKNECTGFIRRFGLQPIRNLPPNRARRSNVNLLCQTAERQYDLAYDPLHHPFSVISNLRMQCV